jgi:hypothetical protein
MLLSLIKTQTDLTTQKDDQEESKKGELRSRKPRRRKPSKRRPSHLR